jgi:hypothetical protein
MIYLESIGGSVTMWADVAKLVHFLSSSAPEGESNPTENA